GEGIDARMAGKALVLPGKQHAAIALVDVARRGRQAPAAVGGGKGAQHPALLVQHADRQVSELAQRRREQAVERQSTRPPHRRGGGQRGDGETVPPAHRHLKGCTVTLPSAVRARVAGSYMSSIWAAG